MVQATTSKVPGANEGLYARIKIEPNTTLAFYNGKRIKPKSKDDYDHPDWEKVIFLYYIESKKLDNISWKCLETIILSYNIRQFAECL